MGGPPPPCPCLFPVYSHNFLVLVPVLPYSLPNLSTFLSILRPWPSQRLVYEFPYLGSGYLQILLNICGGGHPIQIYLFLSKTFTFLYYVMGFRICIFVAVGNLGEKSPFRILYFVLVLFLDGFLTMRVFFFIFAAVRSRVFVLSFIPIQGQKKYLSVASVCFKIKLNGCFLRKPCYKKLYLESL